MTSKIQQAKNEKQLKELARLAENKRCAICTCMGTQYTCQPPSIFVCSTCAGAMYHFPGFRVKSRSMATYTTVEVQQMKEGGNAAFHRQYLAKWNANSFPAPTDKSPKRVEEFIKQVLVDKVFYSETPEENKTAEASKVAAVSSRSFVQQTTGQLLAGENSWKAFSDTDLPQTNSGQSSTIAVGGNWAEFPSVTAPVKAQAQPFDPFASGSPVQASPKSSHSTPADPFTVQAQDQTWEAFQQPSNGATLHPTAQTPQTGWSQFESPAVDGSQSVSMERPADVQAVASTPTNAAAKVKAPAMSPLPEEWFSVGAAPEPQRASPPYPQQDFSAFNPVQPPPPYAGVSAFGGVAGNVYQPGGFAPVAPQSSAFGFNPQAARASLGAVSSFRSTTSATQQWPQPQPFATIQKQDSMTSYVANRVDETSHNPLFQNLDMDMRAKAHSVAGVPIQPTSHALFQNGAVGSSAFNRSGNATFQQSFFQTPPPQTGFDEATGNPFA